MNTIEKYTEKIFEDIKHIDEKGNEYWYARELQKVLNYTQWRRFEDVINKAKIACNNSNVDIFEQFVNVGKLSINVNGGKRIITDYKLSRYACYLIAQNGDPRKEVIALAQTDAKLKRDNVDNEYTANSVHYEVGKEVRNSIKRLGGTMPENLPTPKTSLKELDRKK